MLKFLVLGLLAGEPRYGYDLKGVFEEFLGGMWPLNIGQIYTALGRLEADGLVACQRVVQDSAPDRKVYALTARGERELERWAGEPVDGPIRLRDDFFLKIVVRSRLSDGDIRSLVTRQRRHHLAALADVSRLRAEPGLDPRTALLLDGAALRADADLKWLDLCEERLKELRP